ncbi:hypothetical protein phiAS5_ORF0295 [Aeromonas phage phiAS5]|uniref:Uncharacterized protein n=1 Tax=Aeromonas phage phiAS5 TaxID=879630 RepID=E1A249_9CAUD|nr:hypothetical protein phiAS5_ORF0295 [Aeromonas phage phiAS5]ADM80138.1 hypothetical protein phiAS5_ORF0295 [Aeromonas phage phiAS5]BES53100.1 hypothetical protein [Aeromonas phage phiWae14]
MKKVLAFVALMMFNSSVFARDGVITCWYQNGVNYVKTPSGVTVNNLRVQDIERYNTGWYFVLNGVKHYVTGAVCSIAIGN